MNQIFIKEGKELTPDEIVTINSQRKLEFNSLREIDPNPNNEDWSKKYFLYYNGSGEILAFGRFHDIEILFEGDSYNVLGIATVISIKKRLGYGKILVQAMVEYAKNDKNSVLGFCNNDIKSFYEKSGMQTLPHGAKRFKYKSGEIWASDTSDDCVIGINGRDNLWNKIISMPESFIYASRNHW